MACKYVVGRSNERRLPPCSTGIQFIIKTRSQNREHSRFGDIVTAATVPAIRLSNFEMFGMRLEPLTDHIE
jgi:hypothetical protein